MSSFKVSFELSKELFHPTRMGWCWQGRENTNIQFVPSDKTRIRRVNETQCIAVLSIFWLPPRHKKPKYPHLQRQPSSTARPTLHQTNQGLHLLYTVLHLHHFRFAMEFLFYLLRCSPKMQKVISVQNQSIVVASNCSGCAVQLPGRDLWWIRR